MKHVARPARKLRNAVRLARHRLPPWLPGGFFLTDPARIPDPAKTIASLPSGVGVIIRHFGQEAEIGRARQLVEQCRRVDRVCLIGADPSLARALGADGVHWPARLARAARQQARDFALNTMSAHNPSELRAALVLNMDAALVSTVFASASASAGRPLGLARFARISAWAGLPVYGLGGIDHSNAERVSRFGGFASVSGFQELVPEAED
jgi:thiamine-phosphate pyrophosphorylase